MSFRLPKDIWAPPGNPVLIGLASLFFRFSESYELVNVIFINIIFSTLSLFIFWKISRKYIGNYFLLLIIIIVTSPYYHKVVLGGTSEILFTFFVFLTLYLREIKRYQFSYLVAGTSFLFRYEAIALLVPLILSDIFNKKPLWKNIKLILYGILPVISILLIISIKNPGGNILGNHFIIEIIQGIQVFPNYESLLSIPKLFFGNTLTTNVLIVFLFFSYLCYSLFLIYRKREINLIIIGNFIILYILIHLIFPVFEKRYLFPITALLYLVLLLPCYFLYLKMKRGNNTAFFFYKTGFILLCILISLLNLNAYYNRLISNNRDSGKEIIIFSEWMNNKQFSDKVYVITYPHWIHEYFNKNSKVKYKNTEFYFSKINNATNLKLIFVYDSYIDQNKDGSIDKLKAMDSNPDNYNFHLLTTLQDENKWVRIYTNSDNIF
jgi:hypothetical protein